MRRQKELHSADNHSDFSLFRLTALASALSFIGLFTLQASADTEILPSTSTVNLSVLYPGESTFHLLSGSSVNAVSGDGIYGDSSQDWQLNIDGTVSGVDSGINLFSATLAGASLNNTGTISGNIGVTLAGDGSTLLNRGVITGNSGVAINLVGAGSQLTLDTGSVLNGDVVSASLNNILTLQGTGMSNSNFKSSGMLTEFSVLNMNGIDWTLNGDIDVKNILINSGSLLLTSNVQTNKGNVVIQPGATMQVGNGGTTGEIDGAVIDNEGLLIFYRSDAPVKILSSITGSGVIALKGTGVTNQSSYSLSGKSSTFDGNLIIDNGARLQVASSDPGLLAHIIVMDGGSLWLGSSRNYASPLILQGNGWSESMGQLGALRLDSNAEASGSVTLSGNARVTAVFSDYKGSITGSIGDGGNGYQFEKTGDGVITLSGNNTFSGGMLLSAGTLSISSDANLGDSSGNVTLNRGTLLLTDDFAIAHNLVFGNSSATISNTGTNLLDGQLSGNGSLIKDGSGKLILTSSGSSIRNVNVSGGELALNQSGPLAVLNDFMTDNEAITSLSGSSSLNIGGAFIQSANSSLSLTLGSMDPLINTASANLGGNLNVVGLGPGVPNTASGLISSQYTLIHTTAIGGITGDFSAVNLGNANSSVDYVQLYGGKDTNAQNYNIGFELSWLAGAQKANGIFTLANVGDTFNVDMALADQSGGFTSGWDGKTLTKQGNGTLILSAQNSYTGATIINGGVLQTGTTNVFSNLGSSSGVTIASGATLDLNGYNQTINNISGAGNIALGGAELTLNNPVSDSLAARIEGNGTLRKTGAGLLTLSGDSNFTGSTIIDSGTVSVTQRKALGNSVVLNNALLSLDLAANGIFANQLTGAGTLVKNSSVVTVLTGENSSIGQVAVNGGTLGFTQNNGFIVSGNYTTAANASTAIRGSGQLNIGGDFDMAGTLGVILGTLDNTDPVIQADTANLGTSSIFNVLGYHDDDNATPLQLAEKNFHIIHTSAAGNLSGDFSTLNFGGAVSPVDYIILSGNVDLAQQDYNVGIRLTWYASYSSTPDIANGLFTLTGANQEFDMGVRLLDQGANSVTGWDGKTLTKAGAGTLILSKVNGYTGSTWINGGTLRMGVDDAIASSQRVIIGEGALLDLDSFSVSVNSLSGSGDINLGTGQLTVHNGQDDTLFSGLISGSGELIKSDSGLWVLTSDNRNTGLTTVAEGTLQLGNGGTSGSVAGDILDNGILVFNRSDDILFDAVISGSGQLIKQGAGTLTLNQVNSYGGVTTVADGTLQLGNGGTSGSVAGDILDNGILVFNRSDDIQFDGVISGSGQLVKQGAGMLRLNQVNSYSGITDLRQGTLVVGDDSHSQAFLASSLVNVAQGTVFGGYGGVAGNVDNQGTLAVADALPSFSNRAAGNFSIGGNLTHSGVIVMASPVPSSNLIVKGNYVSNGGLLVLSTQLGGDDSATDKLVIQGDSSGSTAIKVNNAGGKGGQTHNGIQIVSVAGQSSGEFSLINRVVAGAYEYSLYKNAIDANDGNWYLRSISSEPNMPVYRPEAGSYIANIASAGSLFNLRLTDREGRAENSSMWLRQSGSHTRFRDGSGQLKTTGNSYVIQGGGEIFSTYFDDLDRLGIGLMVGYANADSRTHSNQTRYSSKGSLDGYSAGMYATWYQNAKSLDGIYVDSWLQYNWLNASVNGEQLTSNNYDINGYSASLESGYRMPVYQGENGLVLITPQAQVIWNNINANDMTEDNGTRVQSGSSDNLQTRLGLRLSREGADDADKSLNKLFTLYAETNWIYNKNLASVALNGTETQQAGSRNIGEFKVGMDGRLTNQINLWGNVAQQLGGDGYSDTSATIGIKYQF